MGALSLEGEVPGQTPKTTRPSPDMGAQPWSPGPNDASRGPSPTPCSAKHHNIGGLKMVVDPQGSPLPLGPKDCGSGPERLPLSQDRANRESAECRPVCTAQNEPAAAQLLTNDDTGKAQRMKKCAKSPEADIRT